MFKPKKGLIAILALLYIIATSFFIWGLAVGKSEIFPWKQLAPLYDEIHAYFTFQEAPKKSPKEKVMLHHQESRSKYNFGGLRVRDKEFHDEGYLLISGFNKKQNQVIVELFSIADNKVIYTWVPPVSDILERTPNFNKGSNTLKTYRAQHPLLLEDGGLVFTSGVGPMVRINACGDIVWVLEHRFHHSIELDHSGNLVTCSIIGGGGSGTVLPSRDDGVAIVSPEGEIINEYSITKLLLNNSYRGLIYGVGRFEKDRIHLNDAQPILRNTKDARIGDILLSIRHLSSVVLLEPHSGLIKWLKTGPWLNQHDINLLSDGQYSIFGNDIVRGVEGTGSQLVEEGKSDIYIYDPIADIVSQPYSSLMTKEEIASKTQGRSKILSNGDVYIEQTDTVRILRISKEKVRWEYVNAVSEGTVGALHWSRYISSNEIDLNRLENITCN
jgi:hypothetical protein